MLPKTRKAAPKSGPSKVICCGGDHAEGNLPNGFPQDRLDLAGLIAAHRDASRTHLLAGLRDTGAHGAAELALGRFYARRAEALALLAGGR